MLERNALITAPLWQCSRFHLLSSRCGFVLVRGKLVNAGSSVLSSEDHGWYNLGQIAVGIMYQRHEFVQSLGRPTTGSMIIDMKGHPQSARSYGTCARMDTVGIGT
jgi:hypothetical protein